MANVSKNIAKTLIVTTACVASYKIGEAAEERLNKKEDVTEGEVTATLVAVTGVGFGIGLIARAICKKIG